MSEFGKILFIVGLSVAAVGLILWAGVGKNWLGKLPGDIQVSRGNFSLFFPLATCLLISLVLTLLFWLFRR